VVAGGGDGGEALAPTWVAGNWRVVPGHTILQLEHHWVSGFRQQAAECTINCML
jgi:hypothetical protein